MTRCISCGRLPTEDHCEICHRAVRAIARIAYAIGYDETGDEMTELLEKQSFPQAMQDALAEDWDSEDDNVYDRATDVEQWKKVKEVNTEVANQ